MPGKNTTEHIMPLTIVAMNRNTLKDIVELTLQENNFCLSFKGCYCDRPTKDHNKLSAVPNYSTLMPKCAMTTDEMVLTLCMRVF